VFNLLEIEFHSFFVCHTSDLMILITSFKSCTIRDSLFFHFFMVLSSYLFCFEKIGLVVVFIFFSLD
jgi:hypothetical protein